MMELHHNIFCKLCIEDLMVLGIKDEYELYQEFLEIDIHQVVVDYKQEVGYSQLEVHSHNVVLEDS
jgi:hypothetical protein